MVDGIQNAINPTGRQADLISNLWWLMFYVCTAVYIAVMIAVAMAVRKGRRQSDLNPVLNPEPKTETRKRNAVLSAVTLTTIILFVFLIYSFSTGRSLTAELDRKAGLSIEISARQWWWEVR